MRQLSISNVTYITDSSFGRLLNDNPEVFPSWFKDSLIEVNV